MASLLLLVNVLHFIPLDLFSKIYNYFQGNIELIFGAIAVYFVGIYSSESNKRAVACVFGYVAFDLTFFAISNTHFGFAFVIIYSFFISLISAKIDTISLFYILLISGVIAGVTIGALYDYLYSILRAFCAFISKKPLLFGFSNNIYSVMLGNNFESLMLNKYYSASTIVNNELVAGVKNAFMLNTDSPIRAVSYYMSGKYFLSVFVTLGYFISIYSRLSSNQAYAFALVSVLSFCFGDIKLFALFLLVYNPVVYLSYLVATFACYLVPVLLDIRIGYLNNGSIIELIKYGKSWIYFFISGIIIAVMSYFLVQIAVSRFDITQNKILPRDVRKIVTALGGERNIESINSDSVSVKNPNLIDILKLDCEIHENIITLKYGDLELLKEFL